MFNIFEGNADAKARKLQERLEILKRAREDGFFDEPIYFKDGLKPIPEIVADGKGPDDTSRPSPFVKHQAPPLGDDYCPHAVSKKLSCGQCGRPVAAPVPTHKYYTSQPCNLCNGYTRHISYGTCSPVWHCCVCCTCDFCMAEVEQQDRAKRWGESTAERASEQAVSLESAHEQIKRSRKALDDELTTPTDQLFFCTKCGAGLRCTTCRGAGTDKYCDLCGNKVGEEGFCTDCWKEEDKDG